MLITFDLDDTLICWQQEVPKEPLIKPWYYWWFKAESLRLGTVELFNRLREAGWDIGIYTTSHRRPCYIKRLFKLHGLRLDTITNGNGHDKLIHDLKIKRKPSKLPSKVGSDLHIDDSEGVFMEGEKFHFHVLVIESLDKNWTEKIWQEAQHIAEVKRRKKQFS